VKRGVAPSRLSASLMSRPTAVEGSTPGYRPITNHPDWALAFFGFVAIMASVPRPDTCQLFRK
jgi:hypothetical protein